MGRLPSLRWLPSSGRRGTDSYVEELVELEDIRKVGRWSYTAFQVHGRTTDLIYVANVTSTRLNFAPSFNWRSWQYLFDWISFRVVFCAKFALNTQYESSRLLVIYPHGFKRARRDSLKGCSGAYFGLSQYLDKQERLTLLRLVRCCLIHFCLHGWQN